MALYLSFVCKYSLTKVKTISSVRLLVTDNVQSGNHHFHSLTLLHSIGSGLQNLTYIYLYDVSILRNWLLHTIVEVNDARILNFLERLLQQKKLNPLEAVTAVVQSFNHLETSPELLQIAEVS